MRSIRVQTGRTSGVHSHRFSAKHGKMRRGGDESYRLDGLPLEGCARRRAWRVDASSREYILPAVFGKLVPRNKSSELDAQETLLAFRGGFLNKRFLIIQVAAHIASIIFPFLTECSEFSDQARISIQAAKRRAPTKEMPIGAPEGTRINTEGDC